MLIKTKKNYLLLDVASALQKSIRRGDAELAGYWAIELFESGYVEYVWRRLLIISAEDCWGILTKEVRALFDCWREANNYKKGSGRIYVAKAVILLCQAKKSRDADHLTNLVYDANSIEPFRLLKSIEESKNEKVEIPDYAYDVHTVKGKKKGKTKEQFFVSEHEALKPRQAGLFDHLVREKAGEKNNG